MGYIPQTEEDIRTMLETVGVNSVGDLFKEISKLLDGKLGIPDALSEPELTRKLRELSNLNANANEYSYFIGGGAYNHFIPSLVPHLLNRSEFYTAYTPYQPEISQGTLQGIFEFQTYMSMITGMDVSNASMYDGASSAAEAVLMSFRVTKKSKVIVSEALNPDYLSVIKTYLSGKGDGIESVPFDRETGRIDLKKLSSIIDDNTASLVIQSPNFFGVVEDLNKIESIVHSSGILLIVTFTEAFAYGFLRPPGFYGADIVAGEGQSFGIPISYGGPYIGILATKQSYVRTMPGRLVGQAKDRDGERAYVLTLSAREQHIRREKATSNICSNEGLCALAVAIFLSSIGKYGLYEIAKLNHLNSEFLKKGLSSIKGVSIKFVSSTFNEFVIEIEKDPIDLVKYLSEKGIIAGIPLSKYYPEMDRCLLLTVTEMNSIKDIENLIKHIKNYLGN